MLTHRTNLENVYRCAKLSAKPIIECMQAAPSLSEISSQSSTQTSSGKKLRVRPKGRHIRNHRDNGKPVQHTNCSKEASKNIQKGRNMQLTVNSISYDASKQRVLPVQLICSVYAGRSARVTLAQTEVEAHLVL